MADLQLIRTGMRVVDMAGKDVGKVDEVKMGDPEATSAEGQTSERESVVGVVARAVSGGQELPPERRERLLRLGYVKVDAKGLFSKDFYVPADQVDRIEADTVGRRPRPCRAGRSTWCTPRTPHRGHAF